jgi:hypothetical protein
MYGAGSDAPGLDPLWLLPGIVLDGIRRIATLIVWLSEYSFALAKQFFTSKREPTTTIAARAANFLVSISISLPYVGGWPE